jgi:uncharacterized repeat protein (TIGR03803 family)
MVTASLFLFTPSAGRSIWRAGVLATVALSAAAVSTCPAYSQSFAIVYSFRPGTSSGDGAYPSFGVIRDPAGNLYGATLYGGATGTWGSVFEVKSPGKERVLYSFTGGADGQSPSDALIRDSSGNLYGTTYSGGASGYGTIFKVDPMGKESVLYSFTNGADGSCPTGRLLRDASGNLYGAASCGGVSNSGTIFKLSPVGVLSVLYSFTGGNGGPDGANPNGGLVRDAAGNLFGTTGYGGAFVTQGIVFKIDKAGKETILHSFSGGTDGGHPNPDLVRDSSGFIYGTTVNGGASGQGTVFKMDPAGNETVLYSFKTTGNDGQSPSSGPHRDAAGNLYGCTTWGGEYRWGTVYKVDTSGNETVLYSFTGGLDGKYPVGDLAGDAAGNLYGTTQQGGFGNGVVFKLTP